MTRLNLLLALALTTSILGSEQTHAQGVLIKHVKDSTNNSDWAPVPTPKPVTVRGSAGRIFRVYHASGTFEVNTPANFNAIVARLHAQRDWWFQAYGKKAPGHLARLEKGLQGQGPLATAYLKLTLEGKLVGAFKQMPHPTRMISHIYFYDLNSKGKTKFVRIITEEDKGMVVAGTPKVTIHFDILGRGAKLIERLTITPSDSYFKSIGSSATGRYP
jgi:hypothetical protein